MLISKSDLAKYPFIPEAAEYVKSLGLRLEDFVNSDYIQIIDRAEQRIEEAILYGIVNWKERPDYDVEILSFPVSMILVSTIDDAFLKRRYALAEAKRVYDLLKNEVIKEKLLDIANAAFKWKAKHVSETIGQAYDFALHFSNFLKNAPSFHDDQWKLVNRVLIRGYVYLKKGETARLLAEEVREHIQRKLETSTVVELPSPLAQRAERIRRLLTERGEKLRTEELPKGVKITAYPPCIKRLYDSLLAGQRISHIGRFTLTSFLLNVGMKVEDLVKTYTSLSDFDEKLTRYQVEHIAGKRGSGTQYTPPNCNTLRTHGLCLGMDDLCGKIRHPLTYYRRKLRLIRLGEGGEGG